MALSDVLPKYVEPFVSERNTSTESIWLNASELGESCLSPKDSQTYPRLIPLYNGTILDIQSELLHASLSGISIKHFYGKCFQEKNDECQIYYDIQTEMYDFDCVDTESDKTTLSTKKKRLNVSPASPVVKRESLSSENGSSEFTEEWPVEGQPFCTLPKINYRNSFWNIHRPELCKLTWGQKYVSTSTVIKHLHEHLTQHGPLCQGYHTEEDREYMLNKELDDYVRLKILVKFTDRVLECPRELPPDEPPFDINYEIQMPKPKINPKCKTNLAELKIPTKLTDRVFQIDDDDDDDDNIKGLHRSKEEFCLTIGKHMRGPLFVKSTSIASESLITPQLSAQEQEVYGYFYYNWFLQNREENQENYSENTTTSSTFSTSESLNPFEPKPKLIEDEFCRAAGKVDFSDLRCNPDL